MMIGTEFNSDQAVTEGWAIFETNSKDPFRLEKMDDMEVFETDIEAWTHVVEKAHDGSAYHKNALKFLHRNSTSEYKTIKIHMLLILRRDLKALFDSIERADA